MLLSVRDVPLEAQGWIFYSWHVYRFVAWVESGTRDCVFSRLRPQINVEYLCMGDRSGIWRSVSVGGMSCYWGYRVKCW